MTRLSLAAVIATLSSSVSALRVAPGSPCQTSCVSASSPGNATTNGDIVCADAQYNSTDAGKRYKTCMTCLQGSTYVSGSQSDQAWFNYNMRYTFDYCVFGYPDAPGIGSNVCATSEACGKMLTPWTTDIKNGSVPDEYAYCATNDEPFGPCLDCVRADSTHTGLANMIVALQAGCQYRPSTSSRLNLNDTIFAPTVISAINPASSSTSSSSYQLPKLSTPIIIVIAVVSFFVLLIASGCTYMLIRRRRNNKRKEAHESSDSFDFHCQTQMHMSMAMDQGYGINPATGMPYTEHELYWNSSSEKQQAIVQQAMISPLASHPPTGLHYELPVAEDHPNIAASRWGAAISTDVAQPAPAATAGPSRDEYVTPVSTTSMHSQTPFLKHMGMGMSPQINSYSPQMGSYSPQMSSYSPNIGSYSPQEARGSPGFTHEVWTGGHVEGTSETAKMVKVVAKIKGRSVDMGRPSEVKVVQTEFAPPPGQ